MVDYFSEKTLKCVWKDIRRTHKKEWKSYMSRTSESEERSHYFYLEQLSFIRDINTREVNDRERHNDTRPVVNESISSISKLKDGFQGYILKEDKQFCISLSEELNKIPVNRRLASKLKIMEQLRNDQLLTQPQELQSTIDSSYPNTIWSHELP